MLKIRLMRTGRRNRAAFRIVVVDARVKRQGKYLELVGHYDPIESNEEKKVVFKSDRIQHWVDRGAQANESVAKLLKTRGLDLDAKANKSPKKKAAAAS